MKDIEIIGIEGDSLELLWGNNILYVYNSNTEFNKQYDVVAHQWHRIGNPAVIYFNENRVDWWAFNRRFIDTREYCEACGFDEETTVYWMLKYGDELPRDRDIYANI